MSGAIVEAKLVEETQLPISVAAAIVAVNIWRARTKDAVTGLQYVRAIRTMDVKQAKGMLASHPPQSELKELKPSRRWHIGHYSRSDAIVKIKFYRGCLTERIAYYDWVPAGYPERIRGHNYRTLFRAEGAAWVQSWLAVDTVMIADIQKHDLLFGDDYR